MNSKTSTNTNTNSNSSTSGNSSCTSNRNGNARESGPTGVPSAPRRNTTSLQGHATRAQIPEVGGAGESVVELRRRPAREEKAEPTDVFLFQPTAIGPMKRRGSAQTDDETVDGEEKYKKLGLLKRARGRVLVTSFFVLSKYIS